MPITVSHDDPAIADGQVLLTIDHPPVNALDLAHVEELRRCFERLGRERRVHGVLLTGAGGTFSAGVDTKGWARSSDAERRRLFAAIDEMLAAIAALPVPLGVAINGHAVGGAFVLALTGEVRNAADGAYRLGLPEVATGIAFPDAAVGVIKRELDPSTMRRLLIRGEVVDPHEAARLGLVDAVVDPPDVLATTSQAVETLAALPAFAAVKRQLRGP